MAGLRELKKQRTRELIAGTAARLFAQAGFDAVTIDDVARAAEVSRQTVFNYFPSKESMLFDRDAELQAALVAAVRERPPSGSLVEAMRGYTHAFWEQLAERLEGPAGFAHGFWSIMRASPSLQAYAVTMSARHHAAVAAELARERHLEADDPVCAALAAAVCAVHETTFAHGMDRLTDGESPARVIADAVRRADAAYDRLAGGLDRVAAVSPTPGSTTSSCKRNTRPP